MMLQGTTESRTMNTEPNTEHDTEEPVLDDWCNPERAGEGDPLTRALPCPLTLTELGVLGDQIDVLIGQAEDLELEAKSSSSDFRARLASVAEKISRLSRQRRGRVIEREVEISVTQDLARAEEIVTRLDTNEVVSRRTLTRAELADLRQTKIPSVSETGHPEPKAEPAGDPWADLPPPLYPLMSLVDGAILGGRATSGRSRWPTSAPWPLTRATRGSLPRTSGPRRSGQSWRSASGRHARHRMKSATVLGRVTE